MLYRYSLNEFDLAAPSHTGHEIYLNAVHNDANKKSKAILKKNKNGSTVASRLEVAFSRLTQLFFAPHVTSSQRLVIEEDKVWGVATEHVCYAIEAKEGLRNSFFRLNNPATGCAMSPLSALGAEGIPIYFFDKVPQGFLNKLLVAEKANELSIDYVSLASVLTTSFTLEEDDLHKGNFGFYCVEKDEKPQVCFFKIDHDLMFADSIMSFYGPRFNHWQQAGHAFDITEHDLIHFPNLWDSANFYWPTKKSRFIHPFQEKAYRSDVDVDAFASLENVEAFKNAKWLAFYKHILVSKESLERSLNESFDRTNEFERSQINLVLQAAISRQARLKAVLFSIKEFRDCVCSLNEESQKALLDELVQTNPYVNRKAVGAEMLKLGGSYYGFEEGDTPLHCAIKLSEFRYEETAYPFEQFINTLNKSGKSPLDVAVDKAQGCAPVTISQDQRYVMRHLLENGAQETEAFKAFNQSERIEQYQFGTYYLTRARSVIRYSDLKMLLRDIGEDHNYCLKSRKKLAVECIAEFIKAGPNGFERMLGALRKDMNAPVAESGDLLYVRQLRSTLWIIRMLRGLYGWSSTLWTINSMIDRALVARNPKNSVPNSFFFKSSAVDESTPRPQNEDLFLNGAAP